MRYSPKVFFAALAVSVGLLAYGSVYLWNHYRFVPGDRVAADVDSGLTLVFDGKLNSSEPVPVRVRNDGAGVYSAFLADDKCALNIYDESGNIILQDYGTDIENFTVVSIRPWETTEVCSVRLEECVQRGFKSCAKTEPLAPGRYTIEGIFMNADNTETIIDADVNVVRD